MKRALVVIAAALMLTGCTSPSDPADDAASTPTPTGDPATALGLCEVVGQGFLDYPNYVLAISNGEYDAGFQEQWVAWVQSLEAAAPADAQEALSLYTDPIYQVQEVVDQGGGHLSFDTSDYTKGSAAMTEYCQDAGFELPD